MGRRTWIKIFSEKWLRGTIRQAKPEVRGVWIDILALAGDSAYGDDGVIGLAPKCGLTKDQVCVILNITPKLWQEATNIFINTKRISVNGANEITILNWKKYQSEYKRQKKYRIKTKPKVTNESDSQKLPREGEGDRERDINNTTIRSEKKLAPPKKKINFNFDKEIWENITDKDRKGWKEAYPACNIDIEIIQMKEWLLSNPDKRKKLYRRFITNWFLRSQERGGTKYKQQYIKPPYEED